MRLPFIMIRRALGAWAVLLNLAVVLRAQGEPAAIATQLDRIVEAGFKATRCPGLSVAVSMNNAIVYSKALGLADIEQNVPLRTDSVHRLASLSKPNSGTIVMDLVQSGRLAILDYAKGLVSFHLWCYLDWRRAHTRLADLWSLCWPPCYGPSSPSTRKNGALE